jgi:GT2 family glycosyltransferase
MGGHHLAHLVPPRHPAVTVVIPVGRSVEFLAQQVGAVLDQRVPFAFDVVLACNTNCVDGCDALDEIAESAGDARLRVVPAHDVRSAAFARNVGAASSDAEVLVFCDSDDLVSPGWLRALVASISEKVAVGGRIDEQRFAVPSQEGWRPPVTPGGLPTFLGVPYAVSANMAVDRTRFESIGGFDASLTRCEDIALSWRLRACGVELMYEPDAVVHYRHRVGVRELMKQHYLYGIGMAQVLQRYGVPREGGVGHLAGVSALRPNHQPMEHRTFVGTVVRRGSIAAGRVVGLATERHRGPVSPGVPWAGGRVAGNPRGVCHRDERAPSAP